MGIAFSKVYTIRYIFKWCICYGSLKGDRNGTTIGAGTSIITTDFAFYSRTTLTFALRFFFFFLFFVLWPRLTNMIALLEIPFLRFIFRHIVAVASSNSEFSRKVFSKFPIRNPRWKLLEKKKKKKNKWINKNEIRIETAIRRVRVGTT